MGRTYLSKIPTISSNPHTIMLLLIVGEFGYPEVLCLWEYTELVHKISCKSEEAHREHIGN